jgi:hypothetical protein
MTNKPKISRFIEVPTGLFFLTTILLVLVSFLFNFDFYNPDTSLEEDIGYLLDSSLRQKLSSITLITAGVANLVFIPLYLMMFHRFQKLIHIFNSFLILVMAFSFFRAGLTGLGIYRMVTGAESVETIIDPASTVLYELLARIRVTILLTKTGITAFGLYSIVLSVSRFREVRFPVFGSMLLILSGPLIVTFVWLNPEHILLTAGLAAATIGFLMIGVTLVNKGLEAAKK